MIQDPPVTGSAELNSFLVDVKNAINTAAKPLAGWKLSDFEAGVSEVISDKRDLIDIVTAWDDLVNIRNNFETEVARYETLYSDSKVLGNQYQEYADTFSQIMEWWDQNVRLIEDIEAFMIEVNADTSAAASSASAAATSETNAKASETNAEDSASSASSSASSAASSATAAAGSASAAATSEANADESENVALDASAAAIVAAINVTQYTGEGFPEGKVSAPVGSIYTDALATNGAVRWIKASGTGNTGWQVEYGDTGRREITPGGSTGRLFVQRIGTRVLVELIAFEPPALDGTPGSVQVGILPDGFRARSRNVGLITRSNSLADMHRLWIDSYNITVVPGLTNLLAWSPGITMSGSVTFETSHSWPTTLPGTPA